MSHKAETVPVVCECWNSRLKTPWHCACGRWKPAAAPYCADCEAKLLTEFFTAAVYTEPGLGDVTMPQYPRAVASSTPLTDA